MRLPERPLDPPADPDRADCPECGGVAECVHQQPGRYGSATFVCTEPDCGHEWTEEPELPEPDDEPPAGWGW